MPDNKIERRSRNQLERIDRIAAALAQACQQAHGIRGLGQRDQRRYCLARPRVEFQRRRRDDAERSLAAEKQRRQPIPRCVLSQTSEPVDDVAIREYHFEAEDLFARGAVADDVDAARIGRQVAANLAAALGSEAQRKQPVMLGGNPL